MTRNELIRAIAAQSQLNQTQARAAIETAVRIITQELQNGGEIKIDQLGRFSTATIPAKDNLLRGKAIRQPEYRRIIFKSALPLKRRINHQQTA